MRLLKDLSKERLVIVVSHDREYAHQYADRIIELSDGAIISDTQSEYQQTNHSTNYISSSSKISWKTVFKIGSQGFKLHPFRFLSTIFLSLITFTLFSVIFTFSTTTTESRVIQSFKDNHLTQTALTKYFQNLLESKYTHEEYLYLKEELPTTVLPIVSSEITIDNLHNTELLTSIYHQIQP